MPGVHAERPIDKGTATQSISIKGVGITLAGYTDEEKEQIRRRAGDDFAKSPYMEMVPCGSRLNDGCIVTIEIDMVERKAELFVTQKNDSLLLKPKVVWTDLPDKVWVAVAFKRPSAREAILMPCSHRNVTEI